MSVCFSCVFAGAFHIDTRVLPNKVWKETVQVDSKSTVKVRIRILKNFGYEERKHVDVFISHSI